MVHELKLKCEYFDSVVKGYKRAEIRFNDRNYAVGDILELHEWAVNRLTGRVVTKEVIDVQPLDGIGMRDWVLLSMK